MAKLKIWDGSAWVEVKGEKGDTGTPGTPGTPGTAATVTVSGTTTGAAGTNATVTQGGTSTARTLSFTIPRGDKGDKGDTGNTGSTGPNPLHTGTSAPANPSVQGIWIDTSS